MNKVFLVGRLTKQPELRYTENKWAYAKFNVAVDKPLSKAKREEYENKNMKTADFPRIVTWGKQAENCAMYLDKGSLVAIDGYVSTNSFETDDGTVVFTTDITAKYVKFLESKKNEALVFDDLEEEIDI